jgi:dipeptidyl aminopeptidase/acylaminoacyl peptidase
MATVDFRRYKARDGREIPVWVTVPAGTRPGQKLPAIVLAHGGPHVRGGNWNWEPWAQFLASRGYLVLSPEFRGSTGYGADHYQAGWKQWGLGMLDDLADGVAWAGRQGLVDPTKVCIAGASYGGYAALMSLIRHPDVYRCGVAWVAVTEPRLLFKSSWSNDMTEDNRGYYLPTVLGDPERDAEMLRSISPVEQAARLKAPVLMAFGELDRRVPLEHGTRMRAALREQGREPEYVVYGGEGHSWLLIESNLDFAKRLESFLDRNLK